MRASSIQISTSLCEHPAFRSVQAYASIQHSGQCKLMRASSIQVSASLCKQIRKRLVVSVGFHGWVRKPRVKNLVTVSFKKSLQRQFKIKFIFFRFLVSHKQRINLATSHVSTKIISYCRLLIVNVVNVVISGLLACDSIVENS
jgi:hypothetical protein